MTAHGGPQPGFSSPERTPLMSSCEEDMGLARVGMAWVRPWVWRGCRAAAEASREEEEWLRHRLRCGR